MSSAINLEARTMSNILTRQKLTNVKLNDNAIKFEVLDY